MDHHSSMHSTMEHSSMGGDGEDHHAFCSDSGMIMYMDGFRFSLSRGGHQQQPCLNLLFSSWTLNTRSKFILALLCTFVGAILVEGFAKLRYAVAKEARSSSTGRSTAAVGNQHHQYWKRRLLRASIPVLHGLQALAGYSLMLVSMTFSVELLFAVILGLATGYGIFFNGVEQADLRQHVTTNPCCEFMEEESKEALLRPASAATMEDAMLILEGEENLTTTL